MYHRVQYRLVVIDGGIIGRIVPPPPPTATEEEHRILQYLVSVENRCF
jgi:hypothetical protein